MRGHINPNESKGTLLGSMLRRQMGQFPRLRVIFPNSLEEGCIVTSKGWFQTEFAHMASIVVAA